jgi:SAM-dependent methyltransferase
LTEFDNYASRYRDLLEDPLRDKFAKPEFFAERKWILIQSFFQQQERELSQLSWLDVGCGQGELLRMGKDHWSMAAGCDPSGEMLKACDDLNIVRMTDPEKLPFADESFDFITAVCVYHHVPPRSRVRLTGEIKRVLRPGGLICVIEHNPYNPVTQMIVRRTPVDRDAILLTSRETRKLMASTNLVVLRNIYFLFLPAKLFRSAPKFETLLAAVPLGGQFAMFAQKR